MQDGQCGELRHVLGRGGLQPCSQAMRPWAPGQGLLFLLGVRVTQGGKGGHVHLHTAATRRLLLMAVSRTSARLLAATQVLRLLGSS